MKIFLSAVSSQFRPCRDALASDLRAVGYDVVVQEDFQQHGRSLLEKLEQYIDQCDRVIALLGDAYGFEPEAVARPDAFPRRSYTQWEYCFAAGDRLDGTRAPLKDTYVYVAAPEYLALNPAAQPEDEAGLQERFVEAALTSGKDRGTFRNIDDLRAQVLRDQFTLGDREPPRHNLPYRSLGRLFKGRADELSELRQLLEGGAAQPTVIHGLGGSGKTRLAVEYGWLNQLKYPAGMFLVVSDSPESLRQNLASLCDPQVLDLPQHQLKDEQKRVAAVLDWFGTRAGWYLVFDNTDAHDAAQALDAVLPRLTRGDVVIASRLTQWGGTYQLLQLDVLTSDAAADFLLERTEPSRTGTGPGRRLTRSDRDDAAALANILGGLPLALEQAAAYISEKRISLSRYSAVWRTNDDGVQGWHDARVMHYPRSLATTWDTTLSALTVTEIGLLRLLVHFAPDPIPLFVFDGDDALQSWRTLTNTLRGWRSIAQHLKRAFSTLVSRLKGRQPRGSSIQDALTVLAAYSMVRWDATRGTVSVHPVMKDIIQSRLPVSESDTALRVWFVRSVLMLFRHKRSLGMLASVEKDLVTALGLADSTAHEAAIRSHLGLIHTVRGNPNRAAQEIEVALALHEDLGDVEAAANDWGRLGVIHRTVGELEKADAAHREALRLSKQCGNDEGTASETGNLGIVQFEMGRWDDAERSYLDALDRHRALGNLEGMAVAYGNLGNLYHARNDLPGARRSFHESLTIEKRLRRKQGMAQDYANLGTLFVMMKKFRRAEVLLRQSLKLNREMDRPEGIVSCYGKLAGLNWTLSRWDEAEAMYRQALALSTKNGLQLGVAQSYEGLGNLLRERGRLDEAEAVLGDGLALNEALGRLEGIAACSDGLGAIHTSSHRPREARAAYEKALGAYRRLGNHAGDVARLEGLLKRVSDPP